MDRFVIIPLLKFSPKKGGWNWFDFKMIKSHTSDTWGPVWFWFLVQQEREKSKYLDTCLYTTADCVFSCFKGKGFNSRVYLIDAQTIDQIYVQKNLRHYEWRKKKVNDQRVVSVCACVCGMPFV